MSEKSYSMGKHFVKKKHEPLTPSLPTLPDDPERDYPRRIFDIDGLGVGNGTDAAKELSLPTRG